MHRYEVLSSRTAFEGHVISLRSDVVDMPGGVTAQRDVVVHPGAVAVLALRGEGAAAEVLLVNQYRHPVGRRLDELPAGLLDVAHEAALSAAQRELAEEAGCAAATWHVLVDVLTSPGMTDEAIRVFLAQDLSPCARDVQEHEEVDMTASWVLLDDALRAVLGGELENAMAVVGVLAAAEVVRSGTAALRPADAPWRSRPDAAPNS
ncbi:MAG TPA: NUDIX hydrolase [Mycobacteriales bacterium]|nr:NUDIX hydrolase [Mycobacteriales bacterium]